jgi:hypothetical protein
MLLKYLTFSLAISTASWMVGIIGNALLIRTASYGRYLSHLNFLPSNKVNRLIGLGAFKWVVKYTAFRFFNPGLKVSSRPDLAELMHLRKEMTAAEVGHLVAFVFVVIFAVVKSIQLDLVFGLVIMLVNVLMNLYPSLLQQENKRRMDPLIQRLSARTQGGRSVPVSPES